MTGGTLLLVLLDDDESTPLTEGQLGIVVGNQGSGDIVVGTLSITGTDAANYSIVTDPVSGTILTPGQARQVVIEADTTTPGTYLATLRIPSSDPDGSLTVALISTITAALVPGIAVDPATATDFGSVDKDTGSAVLSFTVTSSGTGDLTVGTVSITGSSFAITADDATDAVLAPGESAAIEVTFDPSSVGTKTGQLTVPSDGGSDVVIDLTGTGTTGAPAPEPSLVQRFYLSRQAAPIVITDSTQIIAEWERETTDPDRLLATVRGGPVTANGQTVDHTNYANKQRLGRWISPPLAAQTVDTAFTCTAIGHRSSALGTTVTSALRFGILHGAFATYQLVKVMGSAASPWHDSTAPAPRRFPASAPDTWRLQATFLDGDRLIVELGYRAYTSSNGGARIRYGGASTDGDLANTEVPATVDLTLAPWISFVNGLLVKP